MRRHHQRLALALDDGARRAQPQRELVVVDTEEVRAVRPGDAEDVCAAVHRHVHREQRRRRWLAAEVVAGVGGVISGTSGSTARGADEFSARKT